MNLVRSRKQEQNFNNKLLSSRKELDILKKAAQESEVALRTQLDQIQSLKAAI